MRRHIQIGIVLAACVLLALTVSPISAQVASKITVAPTWSPVLQLTTQDTNGAAYPVWDPDDDYRYVDARLNVTTSVEFWAVELSCTVNGNLFDTYNHDNSGATGDGGDDQPPINWGSDWWGPDGWTDIPATYSESAGLLKVTVAASKQGRNTPFGRNGVNTTVNLGTLRFRVQPQLPTFTGATSPLNCTFSFLDRNGKVVIAPTYTAPAPISIIGGYTVNGVVTYQGRTVKNGIGVDCHVWQGGPSPVMLPGSPTVTNTSGAFTFSNIRQFGWVECLAFGNISDPTPNRQADVYLTGREGFDLNERGSYRFLPLELKAGNVNRDPATCGGGQCINYDDIVTLTQAWNLNATGDVNGDGKTDKADLAIMAGNMGKGEDVQGDHLLYSLARAWTSNGRDSRVWRGERDAGAVTQQVPNGVGTSDFWAVLSPDGSTIVFTRKTKTGTAPARYELFKAPAAGGAATLLLSKAAAGNMDAFAPSWSQDGTRIAFVCSPGYGREWDNYSGYGYNAGDLCMVDATGRNFRQYTNGMIAKIFPPAWEGDWLIFGGTGRAWNGCAETLCVLELNGQNVRALDEHIPGIPNGTSDMPVMSGGRLFYRYSGSLEPSPQLHIVDGFDYESCNSGTCDFVKPYQAHPATDCPSPTNARPPYVHTNVVYDADTDDNGVDDGICNYQPLDVNFDTGDPHVIDYYEVAPYGWELIYYGDQFASDWFYNSGYRWDRNLEDDHYTDATDHGPCADDGTTVDSNRCWPEWNPNTWDWSDSHRVDTYITNDWWSGNPGEGSLLHAERASIDWNP